MYANCTNLTKVMDLSNILKIDDGRGMYKNCTSLTEVSDNNNINEIRSRIMELRYQGGLSPDKRDYNSKDVKSILRGLKDNTLRQELERMDYQTIADYLNNMASLNNTSYKNYV